MLNSTQERGVRTCALLRTKLHRDVYLPSGSLAAMLSAEEFEDLGFTDDNTQAQDIELGRLLSAASALPWPSPAQKKAGHPGRKATYWIMDNAVGWVYPKPRDPADPRNIQPGETLAECFERVSALDAAAKLAESTTDTDHVTE